MVVDVILFLYFLSVYCWIDKSVKGGGGLFHFFFFGQTVAPRRAGNCMGLFWGASTSTTDYGLNRVLQIHIHNEGKLQSETGEWRVERPPITKGVSPWNNKSYYIQWPDKHLTEHWPLLQKERGAGDIRGYNWRGFGGYIIKIAKK